MIGQFAKRGSAEGRSVADYEQIWQRVVRDRSGAGRVYEGDTRMFRRSQMDKTPTRAGARAVIGTVALFACGGATGPDHLADHARNGADPDIELSTDRDAYRLGDQIALTLVNGGEGS